VSAVAGKAPVSAWRHVRAVALLPFMNAVLVPAVLLAVFPVAPFEWNIKAIAAAAAGGALVAAGAALVGHCIALFVRFGSGTLAPWDPTRELVDAGAYRHSRNPLKAGLFLVLAGEALATHSVALLAWFACFAIANALYIRLHEEPGLVQRFGARYHEYCARVPRWWPELRTLHRTEAQ
jgi:protein-S-isoprenylcysteine O-methyltransferase Ste14